LAIYDTAIGWRFVNRVIKAQYGIDSMPETAGVERTWGSGNILAVGDIKASV